MSLATVAHPKFADGNLRDHRRLPAATSSATSAPLPSDGSTLSSVVVVTALSGTHRSTTGTKTRSSANAIGVSTPPSSPGHTDTVRFGSGPTSLRCRPTLAVQSRRLLLRSHAITRPPFPAPT